MKCLGETNCLAFELSRTEFSSYIEEFTDRGLGRFNKMLCLDTSNFKDKSRFTNFFGQDVTKAQFLILYYV